MEWCSYEAEIVRLRYLLAAKTIENEQLKCALREGSSALKLLSINTCEDSMSLKNLAAVSATATKNKQTYFDHRSFSLHEHNDEKLVCNPAKARHNDSTLLTEMEQEKSESGDDTVSSMENNRPNRAFPVDSLGIGRVIDAQMMSVPPIESKEPTEQKSSCFQEEEAEVTMKSIQEGISSLTASIRKLGVSSFADTSQ